MLKDNVIVITGASKGIGRVMAESYSEKGAKIVLAARSYDLMMSFSDQLKSDHLIVKTDVRDQSSVRKMIEKTIDKFGRIDTVINNAGIIEPYDIENTQLNIWQDIMATNLTGPFIVTQEAIKYMKQTGGKIIYIASTAGMGPRPGRCAYSASKAGLINFAMSMAKSLHQFNIKVYNICPSGTATDLRDKLALTEDPGSLMHPRDVAGIVEYCLTEQADVIDAQPIIVRLREDNPLRVSDEE
ncbi:MAG: SDR family NAD(P)-dependent oxidoreductase [Fidelibacterota bacterium]